MFSKVSLKIKLAGTFWTVEALMIIVGWVGYRNMTGAKVLFTSLSVTGILLTIGLSIYLGRSISAKLNRIVTEANTGVSQLAAAASQVASASQEVAKGTQEQASSIDEAASGLELMASMTKQNVDNTKTMANLQADSRLLIEQTVESTAAMDRAMLEIKDASDQTSKIIKSIDEIAFQTNLLALNAAVEAARAGEAGKGFAVVAEEVRNLAMRAADAARDTGALIEENVKRVNSGVQIVKAQEEVLAKVANSSVKVDQLAAEVSMASEEQSAGIEQINVIMKQMTQNTQASASNAEESASATEEMLTHITGLHRQLEDLAQIVDGVHDN
jgi:methyl-accepting chemotaxis protein